MTTRKLIVILHYEEQDGSKVVITAGRCISGVGKTIPWFRIVRKTFVAAAASLCREIAQREAFLASIKGHV